MHEYAPRRDFVDALARTRLVPEQIALQGRDLSNARRHILVCIRLATRTDEAASTHAQLVLGDRVRKALRERRDLVLGQERDRVRRRALALRLGEVRGGRGE